MMRKQPANKPDGFWGEAKGPIKMIEVGSNRTSAVYVIEEPLGYRTVRYNTRKYKVFCPWVYFICLVRDHLEMEGGPGMYAYFSRKQITDLSKKCLLLAPFSNSHEEGGVCMPAIDTEDMKSPLEVAMAMVWSFWASEGKEFGYSTYKITPDILKKGARHTSPGGRIFSNWSKLDPEKVLNLDFQKPELESLEEAAENLDFGYM